MIQTNKLPIFNLITGNEGEEKPSETVIREFEEAITESKNIQEVRTDSYIISRFFFRFWKSGLFSGIFKNQLLRFFKLIFGGHKNYLIVLMGPRFPKCFPHVFRNGLKAIYLFDAWPTYFNYILRFVNDFKIDYLFVSSKQAAESLNKLIGKNNVFWVPEGVKPNDYKFLPAANRNIDVLSFGRKYDNFHQKIVEKLALKKVNYIFSSANEKLFPDKESFTKGLSGAKISVCFPTSVTHPERAGGVETMTNRFLQSMASKCLVLGKAPEEMIQLFGYNPVVEIDMNNPAEQIIEILENYENYSELIEKNFKTVAENQTWANRWEQISTILSKNINQNKTNT
jgi:glycosyltransferase involved in cell wall biosynthesis